MTVTFELDGTPFVALNGGPADFSFNESVSFQVDCADQAEVDRYWEQLSEGGEEGPCGWVKDRYGLSWQVVPTELPKLMTSTNGQQVMAALMQMKKLDLDALRRAAAG